LIRVERGSRDLLLKIARDAMVERGLEPEFSPAARRELQSLPSPGAAPGARDLAHLPWCSIDNDDSLDLDQISASERLPDGSIRLWVAIADVGCYVRPGSELDHHARLNTTSVYTGVAIFPMLPERLSTDLTSLKQDSPRLAITVEMVVDSQGSVTSSDVYPARVVNRSKLAYASVSAWLDGQGPLPPAAARAPGMDEQLRIQDEAASRLRNLRHEHGALELETIEARAVVSGEADIEIRHERKDRAHDLIEDLMIAANTATARFLEGAGYPTVRRVVRSPERWSRIVELATQLGERLPSVADSRALSQFLSRQRAKDPLRFPDLSLSVVKLLGRGEYDVQLPGQAETGHFGLAVRDYIHSTAPNRRFPDLITQRLLQAAFAKGAVPYSTAELQQLAAHCTERENAADRVERQVRKSAAALWLKDRTGETFDGLVTGASPKGVWARLFKPPIEGRIVRGERNLDVGDRVRLRLLSVDVRKGWIDFEAC
jgi:exoribonuclease-2